MMYDGEILCLVLETGVEYFGTRCVRVLHPVHGIRLMHTTYAGVTLAPDWRPV
jgi:hypothetical protein